MDEISKRNFLAINEAIKDDRRKDSERDKKITQLEQEIAMLKIQITQLEKKLNIVFTKTIGNGATTWI